MKINYLSYSSINAWLHGCQKLFFEKNVNGIRSTFESEAMNKGKAFHKALERYFTSNKEKLTFTKKDFTATFASFGILDSEEYFDTFNKYVNARGYENKEIIGIEKEFNIFTKDGVNLFGYFDLIVEDKNNIFIIDFKSDEFERDYSLQVKCYLVAARYLFPENKKNIIFILDFINTKPYRYLYTKEEFLLAESQLSDIWNSVIMANEDDLILRPGFNCSSCPPGVMKNCQYYKYALQYEEFSTTDIKELVSEREKIDDYIKILSKRKEDIDNVIVDKVDKDGDICVGTKIVTIQPYKSYDYSFERIYNMFGDKIIASGKANKTSLMKILNTEEQARLEEIKETHIGKAMVKIKNNKEK